MTQMNDTEILLIYARRVDGILTEEEWIELLETSVIAEPQETANLLGEINEDSEKCHTS